MQNHFSTSVPYQGHLYGFSSDLADGHLIALGEDGALVLAEATPSGYVEKGTRESIGRNLLERSRAGQW